MTAPARMTRAEMLQHLPPRPWSIEESATFSANGRGHVYLVDANGKKIAALWGTDLGKLALAEWLMERANLSIEELANLEAA